jgi:oligopeptide/dipeptide ABC transporter ATP-binding protein
VRFEGQDLLRLSDQRMQRIRGPGIAMVFQEPMTSLNPVFSIGEQITETLAAHGETSRSARRERAVEMLDRVGIPSAARRLGDYPHQLSGGQRQRVMIAMALACRPRLLIADEPTTALDVTIQAQILELLRAIQRDTGMALMLITHDLGVIAEVADRVMVLYAGRVAETAPVRALFDQPAHPYSRALLRSVPKMSSRSGRLTTIDGSVPAVGAMPAGCRFAPRCGLRTEACEAAPPASGLLRPGHAVACLHVAAAGAPAPWDLETTS